MPNLYTLYGTDNSLINIELNKLKENLNIEDIIKYDMTNSTIKEVIEDANTISLFSNKKIIILDNSNFLAANKTIENLNELEKYIEHYNPNTYIIFITHQEKIDTRKKINKLLNKNGKVQELNKPTEEYITSYINNYLKENSG